MLDELRREGVITEQVMHRVSATSTSRTSGWTPRSRKPLRGAASERELSGGEPRLVCLDENLEEDLDVLGGERLRLEDLQLRDLAEGAERGLEVPGT